MSGTDTLGDVLDDAAEVFEYRNDARPQERAHNYLVEHRLRRGLDDTAMLCAVRDMVRRAHAVGVEDGRRGAVREDSWELVEADAAELDAEAWCDRDAVAGAADLVARCKRLAGVE